MISERNDPSRPSRRWLKKFSEDEAGATALEYALILSLIASAIVAIVTQSGGTTAAAFQKLHDIWIIP